MKRTAAPLGWLALLLAAYLCAPLLAALPQIGLANWQDMEWAILGKAMLVSVASATLATVLIGLGGIPLGYVLARSSSRALAALGFIVQLPLALPPLSSGILLLFLVGPYSPIGQFAQGLTDSFTGIVLAQVFVAAPFLIVAARSGFRALDPGLDEVAATLGHGPWRCFISISLPLAWASLRAGLLLSWLRAFGEFGATVMVAYHPYSLPVYTYVAFGSQGLPAMLPLLLPTLAVAIGVALLAAWQRRPRVQHIADAALSASSLLVPRPAGAPARSPAAGASGGCAPGELSPGTSVIASAVALRLHIRHRIDAFSLDITWHARSRRLAILGASGSGKSLTLRLLAGLDCPLAQPHRLARTATAELRQPALCSLIIGQQSLTSLPSAQRQLGYVPQDYGLFPHMTVAEQLAFPVGAQADAARDWLAHLGLAGLEARTPAALSLGQRQRVALARALVRPCQLILLDEPFSALDTPRRRQLQTTLRALQDEISATTILVTHDPDEAALLADEILVLDQGQVLQAGSTDAVFQRPNSLQVAALLGIANLGEARKCAPAHIAIGAGIALEVDPALLREVPDDSVRLLWRIDPAAITLIDRFEHARQAAVSTVALGGAVVQAGRAAHTPRAVFHAAQWQSALLRAGVRHNTVQLGDTLLHSSQPFTRADGEPMPQYAPALTRGEPVWVGIEPGAVEVWPAQDTRPSR